MKIRTHVIVQALLVVVSLATMLSGQVPAKYQPYFVMAASLLQAIIAWINHYFGPDGTPVPPVQ